MSHTTQHPSGARMPAGASTGGQFAASTRAEAALSLTAAPAAETEGQMDAATRTRFVRGLHNLAHRNFDTYLAMAEEADPAERGDTAYHHGLAQGDAMALLLAQGDEHYETHVLAWHGHEYLNSITDNEHKRATPGWARRAHDITLDAPLSAEQGLAAANTLVRSALRYAEQHRSAVAHGDQDSQWYATGALNSVCEHAVALRDGVDHPAPEVVTALSKSVREHREPVRLRPEVVDARDETIEALWEQARGH